MTQKMREALTERSPLICHHRLFVGLSAYFSSHSYKKGRKGERGRDGEGNWRHRRERLLSAHGGARFSCSALAEELTALLRLGEGRKRKEEKRGKGRKLGRKGYPEGNYGIDASCPSSYSRLKCISL